MSRVSEHQNTHIKITHIGDLRHTIRVTYVFQCARGEFGMSIGHDARGARASSSSSAAWKMARTRASKSISRPCVVFTGVGATTGAATAVMTDARC